MDSYLKNFTQNTETEQTHLSFIGGKYNIPPNETEKFYKLYFEYTKGTLGTSEIARTGSVTVTFSRGTITKKKLFLIEKVLKDTPFYYYQDIDFPNEEGLASTNDSKIQEIISKTIEYVKHDSSTIDNIEPIVTKRNDFRYHIHYYNLSVNNPKIATNLTVELSQLTGYPIDTTVYRTGLRMLGSFKSSNEQETYRMYDITTGKYIDDYDYTQFLKVCIRQPVSKSDQCVFVTDKFKQNPVPLPTLSVGGKVPLPKASVVYNNKEQGQVPALYKAESGNNVLLYNEIIALLKEHLSQLQLTFDPENIFEYSIKTTKNKAGIPSIYITPKEKQICPFKGEHHSRNTNPVYIQLNKLSGICVRCFDERCIAKKFPENGIPIQFNEFTQLSKELGNNNNNNNNNNDDIDEQINGMLMTSLSGTHFNIAKVLHCIYKSRFMVDDIRNADWYEFDNIKGKWKKSHNINIVVSQDFTNYYRNLKTEGNKEDSSAPFNDYIDRLINKLESVPFKTAVINEAKFLFHQDNPKFAEKLDNNPYLIGFENGVYDIKQACFRQGIPEDYITFSTGYDYIPYDPNHKCTQEIYDFFSKILTNERVREYTLGVLGRSIIGFPDEKFYIWTGLSGANGKSTLVNFLEMTLGDYAISQDVALLTNKRAASNAATPEIIDIKGKRMVFFQEPEPTDRLRTGILKQYTGGDTIRARELYKKPICFKSMSNFFMCCNDLPHVSSCDGGTFRRIRVTEFKSRFCDSPQKSNEFKIDPDLKWKLDVWRPYFMGILIHYYHKYKSQKLEEPSEVTVATTRYKTDNDKYNDFFEECLEEIELPLLKVTVVSEVDSKNESSNGSFTFTSTMELFSAFEYWWKANYLNEKLPPKSEFKTALRNKYGEELTRVDPILRKKSKGFSVIIRDIDSHSDGGIK
jgi:P4 family phage/plasmid primase-like protien